ncbi:hypothetical protein B566_EDAN017069 [Ephemera danica]|nr:hypothetical protein B566_EDAN017069 [Ephemera danica]
MPNVIMAQSEIDIRNFPEENVERLNFLEPNVTVDLISNPYQALIISNESELIDPENSGDVLIDNSFENDNNTMHPSQSSLESENTNNELTEENSNQSQSSTNSIYVDDPSTSTTTKEALTKKKENVKRLSSWQYVNQKLRRQGKGYTGMKKNQNGNRIVQKEERILGERCMDCKKYCKKRQCDALSEADRREIHTFFWSLNWKQRELFVCESVEKLDTKKHSSPQLPRQKTQRLYYLKKDSRRVLVCPKMFCSTISMNERTIRRWTEKDRPVPVEGSPRRVVVSRPNKTARVEHLAQFLQKLPKIPSHYCRRNTSRKYLEPPWRTMREVYDHYVANAERKGLKPVSISTFKREWRNQKISVYRPRKDECDICVSFKTGNLSQEEMNKHTEKKNDARHYKNFCKDHPSKDVLVLAVDVQAVLTCPMCNASALYYRTKLATHNYSSYDLHSGVGTCAVWNETEGSLAASVFATLLIDLLREKVRLRSSIKLIKIFSDGCGYQNRCKVLSNALAAFSQETGIIIEQYFLEKGHTQTEVDTIHATIETRVRKRNVYVPSDYKLHIIKARPKQPYEVREYKQTEFLDYSQLNIYKNIKPGASKVTDIRALRYTPELGFYYKLNYKDNWQKMPQQPNKSNFTLHSLFEHRLPIKESKFKHLQELKKLAAERIHTTLHPACLNPWRCLQRHLSTSTVATANRKP